MEKKYKYLVRNTGMLTISSFSSKILVFLLVPLYTNVLTTAEYGSYDLIATTISLVLPVFSANIADGVMRFVMDKSYDDRDVVGIGFKYLLIASILFSALLFGNYVTNLWPALKTYAPFVWLYFEFNLLYQFLIQLAKGMERVKTMAIAGLLSTLTSVIGNIVFLLVLHMHLDGFYLAYTLGHAIPSIYLFFSLRIYNILNLNINKSLENDMLAYSLPLIMNTLGWWANSTSDRYAVTWLCGIAANGIYSVAYKIPTILNTVQSIFTQAWQISAIKEYDSKDSGKFYEGMLSFVNVLMCLCCSLLILLTKAIALILYAKDFYNAWQYVPFLLVSSVINTASGVLGPILSARKNSNAMARSAIYGVFTNLVLNILLIYLIGVQGAAIATAISSLVIFISRYKAVQKITPLKNSKRLMYTWVLIVLQAYFSIYLKNSYLLQILCMSVIVFLSKEAINKVLQYLTRRWKVN